jgi:hypothetical protein
MLEGDRYCYENILIHEFGHAVMDLGLQEPVRVRLSLQATCRTLHQRLEADLSTMMMLLLPASGTRGAGGPLCRKPFWMRMRRHMPAGGMMSAAT